MAIEHIFDEIGGFSNFQVLMIAWVYTIKFGIAWSMIMMSYAGYTPDWACLADSDINNTADGWYLDESALHTEPEAGVHNNSVLNVCSVNETNCQEFHFIGSSWTVMSEWNLVCDLQFLKATITAIQMGGVLLGSIIGGQSGDYFGRKKTIYSSYLLNTILNIVTAFSKTWEMFAILRFLIGIQVGIVLVMVVPYPTEFFPLRWRHSIPAFPMWPLGSLAFAGAAWVLKDWANLHIAAAVIALPCLGGYFYIPESARWLATQGRIEESFAVLEKMARLNKRELPPEAMDVIKDIGASEKSEKQGRKYTFIDLFKGRTLTQLTLSASFKWFVLSMVFYGLSFAVNSLSGDLYLNMFLMSVVELPAYLLSFLLIDRLGRRWTCQIFLLIAVLVSFACVGLTQIELDDDVADSIISACCLTARLAVAACWSASQTWVTESYPTVTRSLGYGFANMSSRIGAVLSPFMIDLDNRPLFTFILMGSLSFASMVVTHFIPETQNKVMTETVSEFALSATTSSLQTDISELNDLDKKVIPFENAYPKSSVVLDPASWIEPKEKPRSGGLTLEADGQTQGIDKDGKVNGSYVVERF